MALYEIAIGIALVFASVMAFLLLSIYTNYSKVKHIPGSWQFFVTLKSIPFISPHLFFGAHKTMEKLSRTCGDEKKTVRLSMLDRNVVSICDKDMLKELLVLKGANFTKSQKLYEVFNTFGVNILSALDSSSETWKNHHRVSSGAFASKNLEFMSKVAANSVDLMRSTKWDLDMKKALERGERGLVIDSNSDFSDATLDVLGKAGFGIDLAIFDQTASDTVSEGRIFRRALEKMFTTGVIVKRFVGLNPLLFWAESFVANYTGLTQAVSIVSKKLDQIIDDRTRELERNSNSDMSPAEELADERKDLLSVLVEANTLQKGLLTRDELKSDSYIFALAGHGKFNKILQFDICRNYIHYFAMGLL